MFFMITIVIHGLVCRKLVAMVMRYTVGFAEDLFQNAGVVVVMVNLDGLIEGGESIIKRNKECNYEV